MNLLSNKLNYSLGCASVAIRKIPFVETSPSPYIYTSLPGGTRLFELVFGYAGLSLFLRLCALPPRPELTLHHNGSTSCNKRDEVILKLISQLKGQFALWYKRKYTQLRDPIKLADMMLPLKPSLHVRSTSPLSCRASLIF